MSYYELMTTCLNINGDAFSSPLRDKRMFSGHQRAAWSSAVGPGGMKGVEEREEWGRVSWTRESRRASRPIAAELGVAGRCGLGENRPPVGNSHQQSWARGSGEKGLDSDQVHEP